MRLPVTSSRRCEQITAFGASEVPDVKISAQIASTSGSRPGSVGAGVRGERVGERRRRASAPGSSASAKRVDDEHRRQAGRRSARAAPRGAAR